MCSSRHVVPVILLTSLMLADVAVAQEVRTVAPGSVVSLAAKLPRPAGLSPSDSVLYRLSFADGFRPFGPPEGHYEVGRGELFSVPLTFQVPKNWPAGLVRAATVELRWPDGSFGRTGIEVMVGVNRTIGLALGDVSNTVMPGDAVEVPFSLSNLGNATDSVRFHLGHSDWELKGVRGPLVIPADSTIEGVVQLRVPLTSRTGTVEHVSLIAQGLAGSDEGRLSFFLIEDESFGASNEKLPTSIFLGAFTAADTVFSPEQIIGAITAGGMLGEDTEVSVRASRYANRTPPASFRTLLPSPRFQARVARPTWEAAIGDVRSPMQPLGTSLNQGQGISMSMERASGDGSVLVARPWSGVERRTGHLILADVGLVTTGSGRLGFMASDAAQSFFGDTDLERSQSVGAQYSRGRLDGNHLDIEGGWMKVSDGSGLTRSGPTAALTIGLAQPGYRLNARGRKVPASLRGSTAGADEAYLGGVKTIGGPFQVLGSAVYYHRPILGESLAPSTRILSGGVGFRPSRSAGLQVQYQDRASSDQGVLGLDQGERKIVLNSDVRYGDLWFTLGGQVGLATLAGEETPLRRLTTGIRYVGRRANLSVTGWYDAGGFRPTSVQSQFAGEAFVGAFTLAAGIIGSYTEGLGYRSPNSWANLSLGVGQGLAVVLGAERNPSTGVDESVRFSLGIRKDFRVPLPIRRSAVVEGVVFDDANQNGVRDSGEPGLEGVGLSLGPKRVRTDAQGSFEIHGEAFRGHELRIEVADLDPGLQPPQGGTVPSQGRVQIPLVRTTSGVITLYLDSNGNGTRDEGEGPASGTSVTLMDRHGRARLQIADATGRVVLNALPYGRYTVEAVVPVGKRSKQMDTSFVLDVEAGGRFFKAVGVEDGARAIMTTPQTQPNLPPRTSSLMPTYDLSGSRAARDGGTTAPSRVAQALPTPPVPTSRVDSPTPRRETPAAAPIPGHLPSVLTGAVAASAVPTASSFESLQPNLTPVQGASLVTAEYRLRLHPAPQRIWASSIVRRRVAARAAERERRLNAPVDAVVAPVDEAGPAQDTEIQQDPTMQGGAGQQQDGTQTQDGGTQQDGQQQSETDNGHQAGAAS